MVSSDSRYDNVANARTFEGVAYEMELKDAPEAALEAPPPLAPWDAGTMSKTDVQAAVYENTRSPPLPSLSHKLSLTHAPFSFFPFFSPSDACDSTKQLV